MSPADYLNFLWAMTEKEIKARYKNAILGFLWIFLNPLLQMAIIGFIFQVFIKVPVANYYLFLFIGLLAWNFFSYSLTKTTPSFVFERSLIQKAKFPREAIPLSIVFSNFFHLLVSLLLLLLFLAVIGQLTLFSPPTKVVFFLGSLLWLLVVVSGLSLLTSALNVKYRDINFFVQALVILWFYLTPVIYTLEILPERFLPIFQLNPVTYPFEMLRFSLISPYLPPANIFWANAAISIFISALGVLIFRKESSTLSDWL